MFFRKKKFLNEWQEVEHKYNEYMMGYFVPGHKELLHRVYRIELTQPEAISLGLEPSVTAVILDLKNMFESVFERFVLEGTEQQLIFRDVKTLRRFLDNIDIIIDKLGLY